VYVDWANGTDYLQSNAYLLEKVIQIVNSRKAAAGSTQPNVVIGQSMGGVIARYALRDMENRGQQRHNVRLYISHDAPQQGANVPQGYQHLGKHAKQLYIQTGFTAGAIEVVQLLSGGPSPYRILNIGNEPAARQMLINHLNESNVIDNADHDVWQAELRTLGYPNGDGVTAFRRVAISNGSECALPQAFGPGANLMTLQGKGNTRFLGDLAGMAAFPLADVLLGQPSLLLGVVPGRNDFNFDFAVNAQADGASNQVYKGKITYTKKVLWLVNVTTTITDRSYYSSAATLPYDYFPGGYYDLKAAGFDLQNAQNQNAFFKYNITASNQPTFDFIPTVSALDIGQGNVTLTKADYLARYVGATPPGAPRNTPFKNFITAFNSAPNNNEQHITIERRNGDWLATELNGAPAAANCSFMCSNNNITITGPSNICTNTATYTLNNAPSGAGITITWGSSPVGIVNVAPAPDGRSASVTRITNGQVTIRATINSTSCGSLLVGSSNVFVGNPDISASASPGSCNNGYQTWSLSAYALGPVTTWRWTKEDPSSDILIFNPTSQNARADVRGSGDVLVTATNACGTTIDFVTISSSCPMMLVASPNPTTDDVTVSAAPTREAASTKKSLIYQIKVTDQSGILKRQVKYASGMSSATISLRGLMSGVYIIRAFDGISWSSVQVIKK
jgi:hypothetical protein